MSSRSQQDENSNGGVQNENPDTSSKRSPEQSQTQKKNNQTARPEDVTQGKRTPGISPVKKLDVKISDIDIPGSPSSFDENLDASAQTPSEFDEPEMPGSTPADVAVSTSGSGESAPYGLDVEETSKVTITEEETPDSLGTRKRYYSRSGGVRTPLARRNTLGMSARTTTKVKFMIELLNVANYIWLFFFNIFFSPGEMWTIYVQIIIYACYFSHISTYLWYGVWADYEEGSYEVKAWKPYFPSIERIQDNRKRWFLKFMYIIGFGKIFQHYFTVRTTNDEAFDEEVNAGMWLSYSELFVFYFPTMLLQTLQVEMNGYNQSNLPTIISFYICTIRNVVMMIFVQNYLYWKHYGQIIILIIQVAADIFFRTYTFAIMTVHISFWSALLMPALYCGLNFFDMEWFNNHWQRIYYGVLFTPMYTVSNLHYLYSSTASLQMICAEHFWRFTMGLFVISYQHETFGSIFSILIVGSFFAATLFGIYVLKHHEIYKSRDEIT